MTKLVENYKLIEEIGSGEFGKVFKSIDLRTNKYYAVKAIKNKLFQDNPKLSEFIMNEINSLTKINNPNVVKFIEMLKTVNNAYFVYELCNGGTLDEYLNIKGFLSENEAFIFFKQLLNGFKSIISSNIIHRDLKPQNIFLNDNQLKIGDFGFCKLLKDSDDLAKTMLGSPIYMAPEILMGFIFIVFFLFFNLFF